MWGGQLQRPVLSEYVSTEMSLHVLHVHQLHKGTPRLSPRDMCGTARKVMRVESVPLKRGKRTLRAPNLSPGLPAILVLHPSLEHPRPLPCMGASRGAMGASQILAQSPRLPFTSPGCPREDGQKMGS